MVGASATGERRVVFTVLMELADCSKPPRSVGAIACACAALTAPEGLPPTAAVSSAIEVCESALIVLGICGSYGAIDCGCTGCKGCNGASGCCIAALNTP